MKFDIIIVGGGPAGLAAAEFAAKDGLKVAVLERSKEIGYPIHTNKRRQLGRGIAETEYSRWIIPPGFQS